MPEQPATPDAAAPPDPATTPQLSLAADFPPATREQWRGLVSAVLAKRGVDGDPETVLSSVTYDGVTLKPLYTAADAPSLDADGAPGAAPFTRGATGIVPDDGSTPVGAGVGWDVRTRHADPDAGRTNRAVLNDLETGATSLWLVLGDRGLPVDALPQALEGVLLDLAPLVLDAGTATRSAAAALLALSEQRGIDAAVLRGSFGADPIGTRARTAAPADLSVLPSLLAECGAATGMQLASVDGTVYSDAGASDAQELGIATAVGVTYLRALTDAGLSVDDALARVEFRLGVGVDQFASIAKLRAARRVWSRVAELSGASAAARGQRQHAVTSAAVLTRRDPYVNMLRTTVGCFAAAVAGADAITVLPFDSALGLPDDLGRRIARNTSAVLHDESSLARVVDAAGGSWFVESFTAQLAERAWSVFTDVERAGGALTALDDGTIGTMIATARDARKDDVAHRRAPITGVSEFAFVGERPLERAAVRTVDGGLLPNIRWAEPYETMRDRSDASPRRPVVFLAQLGRRSDYSARAGFATTLFAAGGIDVVLGEGDAAAQAEALRHSGTTVACLCSSDAGYDESGAAVAAALREAGATYLWLAGKKAVAGVDGTVSAGGDALAALWQTLRALDVPELTGAAT